MYFLVFPRVVYLVPVYSLCVSMALTMLLTFTDNTQIASVIDNEVDYDYTTKSVEQTFIMVGRMGDVV